jgi:hypothetical protein
MDKALVNRTPLWVTLWQSVETCMPVNIITTALRTVGTPTWQYISFLCSVLRHRAQQRARSLSLSLCVTAVSAPSSKPSTAFHHSTSTKGNRSTSHAYQICQLTNGKAGWTADICIKDAISPSWNPIRAHDRKDKRQEKIAADTSRREEQRLTAWPWCCMDRALHHSAEHAASSTRPHTCTCHEPQQFTTDLRQVSRASSSTSSLTADRMVSPSPWAPHYANTLCTSIWTIIQNGACEARPGQCIVFVTNGILLYNFKTIIK